MQAQPYDFTLTAGGSQKLDVAGTSFKLLSSTGPVQVLANTGARILVQPGQGIRRFEFDSLILLDKSGAENVGQILITGSEDGAEMIDDRITGEVSVIDGGKARTIANAAFWASMNVPAGAYFGTVQLYNNSSNRMLVVESVGLGLLGGVDASMHIGISGAPLAGGTNQGQPRSKKAGGAFSAAAQVWTATPASSLFPWMVDIYCKVNDTKLLKLNEPIIVMPGYGLCVDCGAQNQNMAANFEFYEALL